MLGVFRVPRMVRLLKLSIISRNFITKPVIQPTHTTHPHLLKEGELMPFVTVSEFEMRRKTLSQQIRESASAKGFTNHIVILPSASKAFMSGKIPYVFRQNSDFLYFTGCFEPDSVLLIHVTKSGHQSYLCVPPVDPHNELWEGAKFEPALAQAYFGVDEGHTTSAICVLLERILKNTCSYCIWYDITQLQTKLSKKLQSVVVSLGAKNVINPLPIIHGMRVKKSDSEIELMKKTCTIGANSLKHTISISKPGIEEFRLWTEMEYQSKLNGAQFLAYPPVVAGGNRANTIHYIYNNNSVQDGELILMDAGSDYFGYSSDITRTWPINGVFTNPQKTLYEALLDVQLQLIRQVSNYDNLADLYSLMVKLLGKNLLSLGFFKSVGAKELNRKVSQYCPHHVSHFLGMDVHDVPNLPRSYRYEKDVIMTVEPGVYVPSSDDGAPKDFRGIGIRIEDDVLVSESGPIVLTGGCPKSVNELEVLVKH
ncbi:xaa-Pro aminopeptidase 3-like isoform X2 [Artemia franciscana]|uniref:Aminopeptidase P N-terminal domain-containing protein n=2 Tax=Artemia franciscana TaxID=6661 RepID=A0AA88HT19_ARTSF|nr:hypothetical protein QYM36_010045 [Artemia franciscana]